MQYARIVERERAALHQHHHHHAAASDIGVEPGLRFAILFPPTGPVRELDWAGIEAWTPEHGFLWAHLERDDEVTKVWLTTKAGLDPLVAETLQAEESRPRVEPVEDDLLMVLRGINHTVVEDHDETDLVALHIWAEANRCITLRDKGHTLTALRTLRAAILAGKGPRKPGPLVARIAEKIVDHLGELTEQIDERLCVFEEQLSEDGGDFDPRQEVNDMRRQIVQLRRYVAPQREALYRLRHEDVSWLCEDTQARIREIEDKLRGHMENLDEMRQRSALLHEEMSARVAEQTNRNTLVMSVVSVIMLPMTFITGYFGMNTSSLPFAGEGSIGGTWNATILIILVGAITGFLTWLALRRR